MGSNIPGIMKIFGFIGSTSGNFISLILPASFYLKTIYEEHKDGKEIESYYLITISVFMVILGIFILSITIPLYIIIICIAIIVVILMI